MFEKVGSLKSQDPIYLGEDRSAEPKEIFKTLGGLLEAEGLGEEAALVDVGCATGELLHYLGRRFPRWRLHGVDVSAPMIERARTMVPRATFSVGSLTEAATLPPRGFDAVVCSGVAGFFDDLSVPLTNLLALANPGGMVLFTLDAVDFPVDVILRFRRSDQPDGEWEGGWNQFSRQTVERLLAALPYRLSLSWHPFEMPFPLPHRPEDPMRTWTMRTEHKPTQTVNGANQLVNLTVLRIKVEG